ncbi:MAG: DUF126 domain-containing protein [Anaerolineae bacterium]
MTCLPGRSLVAGTAEGPAMVSRTPLSFLGGVDPETGRIIEPSHPLQGQAVAGMILVFPSGKGSTVGSYVLYRLAKAGLAPKAIINISSEPIVAVGALISGIPLIDQVDISQIENGVHLKINNGQVCFG